MDLRRARRRVAASSLAAALCLPVAAAAPALGQPVYPSQQQVDEAHAAAAGTASQVAGIEVQLASASARLEQLQVAAAVAAEDYNDAVVELERRTQAAAAARAAAVAAREQVEVARTDIGRLAATSYRAGGSLSGLEAFLTAGGPQELVDKAAALHALGQHRQRTYQRMDAAELVAKLLEEQARSAEAQQQRAAEEAEAARASAARAQATAETEVSAVQASRQALLARLAELRRSSVELETQRQAGLEEERRRREEAAARAEAERREAEARADEQRRAEERAAEQRRAEQRRQEEARRASRSRSQPAAPPAPVRAAPEPAAQPASVAGSSAGERAVAWAAAQVGKDYQWGASGPNTFDCSGLTSQAWRNGGGTWITRTSRSQWAAVGKVPYSQMRAGDLIFYATNPADPSTIWHVAIYAGDGMMVEAPRTGLQVRKVPVRWTNAMPAAGRP